MRRLLIGLLLMAPATALFGAWLPSRAQAASVEARLFADFSFEGEVNNVTAVRVGDTYQITDTTATLFASAPCSVDATGHVATCPVPTADPNLPPFSFWLGAQNDKLSNLAADVSVSISGMAGDDMLTGGGAAETIDGADGDDTIHGGDGDDFIFDGPDDDLVDGGAGQDNLQAGDGADDLLGGPGVDLAYYGGRLDQVQVVLDDQPNDGEEGELDYVAGDVENITGGHGDDRLIGNDADNVLAGHEGSDVIAGAGGADGLTGAEGNDVLDGGSGPDSISGREGDDQITARDGERDSIRCGIGTDSVVADYDDSVTFDCELVDRSLPPPPPPPPPIDTTAPALQLSGATVQKVLRQRGVLVVAACPGEACAATAKGRVSIRRSAKVFRLTPVTRQIAKDAKATLKLKLQRRALRAIARALRAGKRVRAKITVTAKDAAGNVTTKRRAIRLKR